MESPFCLSVFVSFLRLCPLSPLLSRPHSLSLSGIQPLMMTQGEQRREGGREVRETVTEGNNTDYRVENTLVYK